MNVPLPADKTPPHFLLVGNGPYANRGCEAIVRGTMAILRHEFGENFRVTVATFADAKTIDGQSANETDPLICHVSLSYPKFPDAKPWSKQWLQRQWFRCHRKLVRTFGGDELPRHELSAVMDTSMLDEPISTATCALQVGGDNYSMDYGLPSRFMWLDRCLWSRGVPVSLWGASVGPFDAHPAFKVEMFRHLQNMKKVYVRESRSYDYLRSSIDESRLHLMADPAFAMDPVSPRDSTVPELVPKGAIGFNVSPLMAKYVTHGSAEAWVERCSEIIRSLGRRLGRPIVLIPHVTAPHPDDHVLLVEIARRTSNAAKVTCIGNQLSAAETKWVIAKCDAFVGARTHSTIAAFSSCVPTLSLAYSVKALGLNQDILGSLDYCLPPHEITPEKITERVDLLLRNSAELRNRLATIVPELKARAIQAGRLLGAALNGRHSQKACDCDICKYPAIHG